MAVLTKHVLLLCFMGGVGEMDYLPSRKDGLVCYDFEVESMWRGVYVLPAEVYSTSKVRLI